MLDVELPEDPAQAMMTWYGMLNHAVTQQGRARGEPTPDLNAIAVKTPVKAVEFIFPHYFLLPYLSSMSAYRIRPLGPESCLFELWSLTHFPEGKEPAPVMEPVMLPHDSDSSRRFRGRTIRTFRASRSACMPRASNSCACRRTSRG